MFSRSFVLVSTLSNLLIRIKSTKKEAQLIHILFIVQCTATLHLEQLLNILPPSGQSAPVVSGLSQNLLSGGVKLSRRQCGSCCRRKPLAELAGVILDGWLDHGQVGTRSAILASLIKYIIYHIHHTYLIYS